MKKSTRLPIFCAVLSSALAFSLTACKKAEPLVFNAPSESDLKGTPKDADKSASGLAWKIITPAPAPTGDANASKKPGASDIVSVHYTGWTTDGKKFDSSVDRGQPASFPLNRVIPGWTEGVQLMTVGEKRRFWIPAELAYGETPSRPGAPAGLLIFDVELLSVQPGTELAEGAAIPAPSDVAAVPADAERTASGLAWKKLPYATDAAAAHGDAAPAPTGADAVKTPAGTGTPAATADAAAGMKPGAEDIVTVHYTGWTTDGKMFDSSLTRGRPASFPLNGVIKGWTEGVQLMSKGDKRRFWIPAELAYGATPERAGAPAGMLVFDIELLDIKSAAPEAAAAAAPAPGKTADTAGAAVPSKKPTTQAN